MRLRLYVWLARWAWNRCRRQITYHEGRILRYRTIEAEAERMLDTFDPWWREVER